MATVVFPYNHARDPMNPDDLGDRIAGALNLATNPAVDIDPARIVVTHPNVTEANRATIQGLIDVYTLDPAWSGGTGGVIRRRLQNGIATNAAYLALASPTAAQTTAQVQALTRETTALARIVLGLADDARGT